MCRIDRIPEEHLIKQRLPDGKYIIAFVAAGIVLMNCFDLHAQTDRNWINALGGTFSDTANWQGGIVPAPLNDTARFATNGTFTVTFNADVANRKANFDAKGATVTLDLSGYTWNLTNWWDQGPSAANTNTVLMNNGTLRSGSDFSVAKNTARASFQMLHVDSVLTNASPTTIGNGSGGYGELIVLNGNAYFAGLLAVGNPVNSTGMVKIANGTIKTTATGNPSINVGATGKGSIILDGAGAMLITTGGPISIARNNGGSGSVIISNGTWDASQDILVGNAGLASIVIENGTLTNRYGDLQVSYQTGTGIVILASANAKLYAKAISLGGNPGAGDGIMIVSNGYVQARSFNMGWRGSGSAGFYTMLAGTSIFNQANSLIGDNANTTGTLTMADGVLDFESQVLTVASSGHGYFYISGGQVRIFNELRMASAAGSHGLVNIDGGTTTVGYLNFFASAVSSGSTAEFIQSGGVLKLGRYGAYAPSSATTNVWLSGGTWVATNNIDTVGLACNLTLTNSPGTGVFTFNSGNYTVIQHGAISGPGSLVKTGNGALKLRGANSYSGNTTVEQGTLASEYAGGITNSPVITVKSGASIDVSLAADHAMNIENGELIQGAGSIVGTLALHHGTILPGDDGPGTFSASSLVLSSGTIQIEVSNAAGSAGVDWGMISVGGGSGGITNQATSADPIVIDLLCDVATLPGFDGTSPISWMIVDAGSHVGFASNTFSVSIAGFLPPEKLYGVFTVSSIAGDLYLNYIPANAPVDLTVSISASTNYVVSGESVAYTVVVSNNSASASGLYFVTNSLGSNLSYSGGTTGAIAGSGFVSWTLGGLAAGASTTLVLNATPLYTGSTQELNNVVVSTVFHVNGDPVPGNNSSSAGSVTSIGIPMLSTWGMIMVGAVVFFAFYRMHRRHLRM